MALPCSALLRQASAAVSACTQALPALSLPAWACASGSHSGKGAEHTQTLMQMF